MHGIFVAVKQQRGITMIEIKINGITGLKTDDPLQANVYFQNAMNSAFKDEAIPLAEVTTINHEAGYYCKVTREIGNIPKQQGGVDGK